MLFFTKGEPTRKIWYYDLAELKVRKKTPLTMEHFEDFIRLLPREELLSIIEQKGREIAKALAALR